MPTRVLSLKVGLAALTAALAIGGVAVAATVGAPSADSESPKTAAEAAKPNGDASTDRGPNVAGPARDGLCQAWVASKRPEGQDEDGEKPDAALEALVEAAGGEDRVASLCASSTSAPSRATGNAGEGEGKTQAPGLDLASESNDALCRAWATSNDGEIGKAIRQRIEEATPVKEPAGAVDDASIKAFCAGANDLPGHGASGSGGDGGQGDEQGSPQPPVGDDADPSGRGENLSSG